MSYFPAPIGRGFSLNIESGVPPAGDLDWGVFCYDSGVPTTPTPDPVNSFSRFESLAGKTMSIKPYHSWFSADWLSWIENGTDGWETTGSRKLIHTNFWDPEFWTPGVLPEDATWAQFEEFIPTTVTDGNHDTILTAYGDYLADQGEIWFRTFHEFNHDHRQTGRVLPWDAVITDDGGNIVSGASEWIAAWRYIVNLFRSDCGATNVKFLWSAVSWPSSSYGSTNWVELADFYPGDSYVDAIGASMYLQDWYPPSSNYSPSDSNLLDGIYDELCACTANKPVWFAESGAEPHPSQPAYKPQYLTNLWNPTKIASDFPRVTTIFQWDSYDLRIETTTDARDAWITEIQKSNWKNGYY